MHVPHFHWQIQQMAKRHAPRGKIKATGDSPSDPMVTTHPMTVDLLVGTPGYPYGRCTAQSKQRADRCEQPAIPAGRVCRFHGGSAPQVRFAAHERLKEMQEPATVRLYELMMQKEFPSTAISAVKDILDRTMGKALEKVELAVKDASDVSDEELKERIRALLDKA
jgi:hypothetical protein